MSVPFECAISKAMLHATEKREKKQICSRVLLALLQLMSLPSPGSLLLKYPQQIIPQAHLAALKALANAAGAGIGWYNRTIEATMLKQLK